MHGIALLDPEVYILRHCRQHIGYSSHQILHYSQSPYCSLYYSKMSDTTPTPSRPRSTSASSINTTSSHSTASDTTQTSKSNGDESSQASKKCERERSSRRPSDGDFNEHRQHAFTDLNFVVERMKGYVEDLLERINIDGVSSQEADRARQLASSVDSCEKVVDEMISTLLKQPRGFSFSELGDYNFALPLGDTQTFRRSLMTFVDRTRYLAQKAAQACAMADYPDSEDARNALEDCRQKLDSLFEALGKSKSSRDDENLYYKEVRTYVL